MSEQCKRMETLLSPWRDGELDAAQAREVAEHVADCAACQARVSAWHEAEAALGSSAPSRSDVEWERLAQRVEQAIDADELLRIAETLPGDESADAARPAAGRSLAGRAADEEEMMVAAAAGAPADRAAPPRRAGDSGTAPSRRARRPARWWVVGSGLAAAALVVLFWPWFDRSTRVAPGPGALRERVGAAGRIEAPARTKDSPSVPGQPDLLETAPGTKGDPAGRALADADVAEEKEFDGLEESLANAPSPAAGEPQDAVDEAATGLHALGGSRLRQEDDGGARPAAPEAKASRKSEASDEATPQEAAPLEGYEALATGPDDLRADLPAASPPPPGVTPAAPRGAESFGEVVAWVAGGPTGGAGHDAEPLAKADAAKLLRSTESVPESAAETATPATALRLAHEARDAGDRERAREGYRLLAGDFPGNTVREEAWYALTELQTEDVRAGSRLGPALEAAASLDAFRTEYPDSRFSRGVLAARVFVWARLVELDPAYCEEAGRRVQDWQTGIEAAPQDVLRAVAVIADGCAR